MWWPATRAGLRAVHQRLVNILPGVRPLNSSSEATQAGYGFVSRVLSWLRAPIESVASIRPDPVEDKFQKWFQNTFDSGVHVPHDETAILLLGETGAGKTSFLNLLCNFSSVLRSRSVDEVRDFRDLRYERNPSLDMLSKTTAVVPYRTSVGQLPFVIVDTPGLGDTEGPEIDQQHADEILESIGKLGTIHATVLVISGRNSKMTAQLKYVLSRVRKFLPPETSNSFVVVFTNVVDELYVNFEAAWLAIALGQEVGPERQIFIENPFVMWERRSANGRCVDPVVQQKLPHLFEAAQRNLSKFFRAVVCMPRPQNSVAFGPAGETQDGDEEVDPVPSTLDYICNLCCAVPETASRCISFSRFAIYRCHQRVKETATWHVRRFVDAGRGLATCCWQRFTEMLNRVVAHDRQM
mmetsp:Transcript_4581/g.11098  ORF Transcript_4581/g.11098 Transcript_4581/m.11098 type:complete len:410 (-) Transcript_4581:46-1275(-)